MESSRSLVMRRAEPEDMPAIYLMGYDEWGDGADRESYLKECAASKKYALGSWYVLAQGDELRSALICYKGVFRLAPGVVGIGSVATVLQYRRQGHASELIQQVMKAVAREEKVSAFALYSDVDPLVYEKLGFVRLPAEHQRYKPTVGMLRPALHSLEVLLGPGFQPPDYF